MNYRDANQLHDRRDHKVVNGINEANFRTLPNKGVSLLVRIIAAYLKTGNCARFAVLSGTLSAQIIA